MNKRIAKKVAKNYLNGKPVRYILGYLDYWYNSHISAVETIVPGNIRNAIYAEAYRRGWDGCHWDNPLVEYFDMYDY